MAEKKLRALLFDPYLDTLGGGERYLFFLSQCLLSFGYQVEIAWPDRQILDQSIERFNINTSLIKPNQQAYELLFSKKSNLFDRFLFTRQFDLIFWFSDGSLPLLFARKNLIHFQVPFTHLGGNFFFNQLKSLFVSKFIYNSQFTRQVIEKSLPFSISRGKVFYPPIDTLAFKSNLPKKNLIISVGRFDSPSHSKRQDILISAFKDLFNQSKIKYQLILAGGVTGSEGQRQVNKLKQEAKSFPIEILTNPDFATLKQLYAHAKFFWHAAGFGIDEKLNPEKVEHFGMTTVEAMAAGAIPLVHAKGGQKEIITSSSGFLWQTPEELVSQTLQLIKDDKKAISFQKQAIKRAQIFSQDNFFKQLSKIVL